MEVVMEVVMVVMEVVMVVTEVVMVVMVEVPLVVVEMVEMEVETSLTNPTNPISLTSQVAAAASLERCWRSSPTSPASIWRPAR